MFSELRQANKIFSSLFYSFNFNEDIFELEKDSLYFTFKPTNKQPHAKLTKLEDETFIIILFATYPLGLINKEAWSQFLKKNWRNILISQKSSFIHEYIHYLDLREEKEDVYVPNVEDDIEYYNHPKEIRAFIAQGLSELETYIENTLLNKQAKFQQKFGNSLDSFLKVAVAFFNRRFIQHLKDKEVVLKHLKEFYNNLVLKEYIKYELVR